MQSRAFSLIIFVIAVVFSTGAFLSVGISPKPAPKPTVLGVAAQTDEIYIATAAHDSRVLGETVELPNTNEEAVAQPEKQFDEVPAIDIIQETSENFSNTLFTAQQIFALNIPMSHSQPEYNRCIQIAYQN